MRVVPADEVDDLAYVRTTCTWRGSRSSCSAEHDGWLRVEYTGGRRRSPQALGLEEFDFGVYQGWAPAARSPTCANSGSDPGVTAPGR